MSICKRCGKNLNDPKSIRLELGPICRILIKNEEKDRTEDMFGGPDFDYEVMGSVVVIYDLDKGGKSVTNGIDMVLEAIAREIGGLSDKKVIYRDSQGVFDGVNTDKTKQRFFSIGEESLNLALKKIGERGVC